MNSGHALAGRCMKVVYFQRRPNISNHSIERVFATVRGELKGLENDVRLCRFESRGIWKRLYNMVEAALRQGDINHITGDVHYLAFLLRKDRTLLTVHDCGSMLRLQGVRRWLFQWLWLKLPVLRCSVVSVISEHTKKEVLEYTSCIESKIRVVPDPVGAEFQPAPRKFNTLKPRILQVGAAENKNLGRLAAALAGINCKLDIIGAPLPNARDALEQFGIDYAWLAELSDAEVAGRYREADVVVFCSTSEGFGMPIVEGNAIGRPVVTSDLEPMRTVAGGAACLVDPFDIGSIRGGILRVVEDTGYREELVRRGFENVKRFEAQAIASSYAAIYAEFTDNRARRARGKKRPQVLTAP